MANSYRFMAEETRLRNSGPLVDECHECDGYDRCRVTKYGYICYRCEVKLLRAEIAPQVLRAA